MVFTPFQVEIKAFFPTANIEILWRDKEMEVVFHVWGQTCKIFLP